MYLAMQYFDEIKYTFTPTHVLFNVMKLAVVTVWINVIT